jgi:nucleotide-binding universal stress UspA family protein
MTIAPTYLVIIDGTEESRVALRFAAQRASHVGASVTLLHVMREPEFMPLGAVQAAMRAEAEEEGGKLLAAYADEAEDLAGTRPETQLLCGEPGPTIHGYVQNEARIRALVLATAVKGAPGPLIAYFSGERIGQLPCVIITVPGGLSSDRIVEIS